MSYNHHYRKYSSEKLQNEFVKCDDEEWTTYDLYSYKFFVQVPLTIYEQTEITFFIVFVQNVCLIKMESTSK